MGSDGLELW